MVGRRFYSALIVIGLLAAVVPARAAGTAEAGVEARVQSRLDAVRDNTPLLRQFLAAMPKGGDLHNHLRGAVYAESFLDWGAEDGLCARREPASMVAASPGGGCPEGAVPIADALADPTFRRGLINAMSVRSYVPTLDYSGHNDFFDAFDSIVVEPHRMGDALAEVAARAARQNILYLELMETIVFPELIPLVSGVELTGDAAADYELLMASPFGEKRAALAASISAQIRTAMARKAQLLACDTDQPDPGCAVEIRLLHQVLRAMPPALVYAQIALGWEAIRTDDTLVGINLVQPEDWHISLRDYRQHMAMIDHLYQSEGARNVTLHAGELALGLVRPDHLRFHIRSAIEQGHAKRIGHGVAIAYEDDSSDLLDMMAARGIAVEINLTSNDVILGIKDDDHPWRLYRQHGVPLALSTDDEGVARGDLTAEYMRALRSYGLDYTVLKELSRNSLAYSFLPPARKQAMLRELDARFALFEQRMGTPR